MGKLLKIISFAHDNNYTIGNISGNNVLIEPDKHYVIVFNWSMAEFHHDKVPASDQRREIQAAANLAIKLLGDALDKTCDADLPYVHYLRSLVMDGEYSAREAHRTFYEIVDALCEIPDSSMVAGFHEFTTLRV